MTTTALVPVQQPVPQRQPNVFVNNPYIQQGMVCFPVNQSLNHAMPVQYPGMSGLGELTDTQVNKMIMEHFSALPSATYTKILAEGVTGNMDTLRNEIRILVKKICTAGVIDEASSLGTKIGKWLLWVGLAIVFLFAIKKLFFK